MSNHYFSSQAQLLAAHMLTKHGLDLNPAQAVEAVASMYLGKHGQAVPPGLPPEYVPRFKGHTFINGGISSDKSFVVKTFIRKALDNGASVLVSDFTSKSWAPMLQPMAERLGRGFSEVHVPAGTADAPENLLDWKLCGSDKLESIAARIVEACLGGNVLGHGAQYYYPSYVLAIKNALQRSYDERKPVSVKELIELVSVENHADRTMKARLVQLAETMEGKDPFARGIYDFRDLLTPHNLRYVSIDPAHAEHLGYCYLFELRRLLQQELSGGHNGPVVMVFSGFRDKLGNSFEWEWFLADAVRAGVVLVFEDEHIGELPAPLGQRGVDSVLQVGPCTRANMAALLEMAVEDTSHEMDILQVSTIGPMQLLRTTKSARETFSMPTMRWD